MPYNEDLTQTDLEILNFLQQNGRASYRQVAHALNKSVSTIKAHIDKLTEMGVIQYYTAVVDCSKLGYREMTLLYIRVNSQASIKEIIEELAKNPQINCLYQISGTYPLFAIAKCIEKKNQIQLVESIKSIPGVEEVRTEVVLDRIKEDMRVFQPINSDPKFNEILR